jgi:shikimate dehydrogenase
LKGLESSSEKKSLLTCAVLKFSFSTKKLIFQIYLNLKKLQFGLIGKKLGHSFSQKYFMAKFEAQNLPFHYALFEMESLTNVRDLAKKYPNLRGLNVTIPYKKQIFDYLDEIEAQAQRLGAVNTILIEEKTGKWKGFNTDYIGFEKSLKNFYLSNQDLKNKKRKKRAFVLGNGGAAAAVFAVLQDYQIDYQAVSRQKTEAVTWTYEDFSDPNFFKNNPSFFSDFDLIIQTTPVGMAGTPQYEQSLPPLPAYFYDTIHQNQFFIDLIYNPEKTYFLQKAQQKGAKIENGLPMLHGQAEAAWQIWYPDENKT